MPLLWSANYPDLDNNLLNAAKKKIFKSSVEQYTNIADIQSNIQPTQSQMNEFFLRITTTFKQLNQQLRAILNGADPNKVAQDFGPIMTEFINEFNIKIFPVYNYFSPQQNELIRRDIIYLLNLLDEVEFANLGQVIDNFSETLVEEITNLGEAIRSYSPLKINLRKGRKLLPDEEEVQGGYISGGSRNKGQKYPEIRFL